MGKIISALAKNVIIQAHVPIQRLSWFSWCHVPEERDTWAELGDKVCLGTAAGVSFDRQHRVKNGPAVFASRVTLSRRRTTMCRTVLSAGAQPFVVGNVIQ